MEQEVLRHRNAVFNRLYFSSLTLYKACVPIPLRWLMEVNLLFMAFGIMFIWGYTHFTYIVNPRDCLSNIVDNQFPRDAILQVEVYSNTSEIWLERQKALQNMHNSGIRTDVELDGGNSEWIKECCETSFLINLTGTNFFCQLILTEIAKSLSATERNTRNMDTRDFHADESKNIGSEIDKDINVVSESGDGSVIKNIEDGGGGNNEDNMELSHGLKNQQSPVGGVCQVPSPQDIFYTNNGNEVHLDLRTSTFYFENRTLYELLDFYSLQGLVWDYTLLEFSQEPGYLSLTTSTRSRLNISVVKIYLDPSQTECFGGPFGQFLTEYFLGYDMMVISSFKSLLPSNRASGYVKNILTGSQYYYKVQWMGKWRYGAGFLPALFFTLVASVLLRRIHYHVFKFLTHFHHLLNQGIPMPIHTGAQIPFLIVTYATIGLVIVMSEALSDDSVFSLLMVGTVWEVDQFYSLFCKQNTSKLYLPWFFFLYHFLPYAYYIRFNGQFWFLPFLFHWLLLQHAMLFFLHHCELPSLDGHQRDPAPINHRQHPGDVPPAGNPEPPAREVLQQEEQQNGNTTPEQATGETHAEENDSMMSEENNNSPSESQNTLSRPQLHRTSNNSLVTPATSADPLQERNSQLQLTGDEVRKIRLQHFEKRDSSQL